MASTSSSNAGGADLPASASARSTSASPRHLPLPPGPRGYPVIGNLPDVIRLGMPELMRQSWQRYGDVVRFKVAGRTMILMAHPDHVRHVLYDNRDNYYKGETYQNFRLLSGNGLITSEGDFWKRQRRLAAPAFHTTAIAALGEIMTGASVDMLNAWDAQANGGPGVRFDLHQEMTRITLRIVGESLFGQDLRGDMDVSAPAFAVALREVMDRGSAGFALPMWLPTPGNRRLRRALEALDALVYRIIDHQRRQPSAPPGSPGSAGHLLAMFMAAVDEETGERMDDRQLRDEIITMYLAGHETTALALTWTWHLLSHHPAIYDRLEAELAEVLGGRVPTVADLPRLRYTRMVLEESMRLYSPVWTIARDVRADDAVSGYHIPAGATVMLSQYVVHRRPELWPDPERFDPERFTPERVKERHKFAYFPFSTGPRVCIGNTFTLVEGTLILATVCQRYRMRPLVGPVVPPDIQITYRPRGGLPIERVRRG
jgi:cytochrome P450